MNNKFNQLFTNILIESTNINSTDNVALSIKRFTQIYGKFFKQLKNQELSNEIAKKVLDYMANELKLHIGEMYEIEFINGKKTVKIIAISDDNTFLTYEDKNRFIPTQIDTNEVILGMLMTDKAWNLFRTLILPELEKAKARDNAEREAKRIADEKAKNEKRATYENPEVQKFIDSIPKILIGDYTYGKRPLPDEWVEEFKAQPENVKIGFINWIDDMKFHDESIEYVDLGYFREKDKEAAANKRLKDMVAELKQYL